MDDIEVERGVTLEFPTEQLDFLVLLKFIMSTAMMYMTYKGAQLFGYF